MSIKYLCYPCAKLLKVTGVGTVNKDGRKFCEGCKGNEDNIVVVDAEECDHAIDEWNRGIRR